MLIQKFENYHRLISSLIKAVLDRGGFTAIQIRIPIIYRSYKPFLEHCNHKLLILNKLNGVDDGD